MALRAAGCAVVSYSDSMIALNDIESCDHIDVMVTRVTFSPGKPNGISLTLVLRTQYPALKVMFVAQAEHEKHIDGIGELIPAPVDAEKLIQAVLREPLSNFGRPQASLLWPQVPLRA